jgi:hypothetical protein
MMLLSFFATFDEEKLRCRKLKLMTTRTDFKRTNVSSRFATSVRILVLHVAHTFMTLIDSIAAFLSPISAVELKMAISRLTIIEQKQKSKARATTKMLLQHHETEILNNTNNIKTNNYTSEKAKMLAESLIRDRNFVETCSTLAMMCELLQNRMGVIRESSKRTCPADLKPAICTLIYSSKWLNHHNAKEFDLIRKQFERKYGRKFVQHALSNSEGSVAGEIVSKLSASDPISPSLWNKIKSSNIRPAGGDSTRRW